MLESSNRRPSRRPGRGNRSIGGLVVSFYGSPGSIRRVVSRFSFSDEADFEEGCLAPVLGGDILGVAVPRGPSDGGRGCFSWRGGLAASWPV